MLDNCQTYNPQRSWLHVDAKVLRDQVRALIATARTPGTLPPVSSVPVQKVTLKVKTPKITLKLGALSASSSVEDLPSAANASAVEDEENRKANGQAAIGSGIKLKVSVPPTPTSATSAHVEFVAPLPPAPKPASKRASYYLFINETNNHRIADANVEAGRGGRIGRRSSL